MGDSLMAKMERDFRKHKPYIQSIATKLSNIDLGATISSLESLHSTMRDIYMPMLLMADDQRRCEAIIKDYEYFIRVMQVEAMTRMVQKGEL